MMLRSMAIIAALTLVTTDLYAQATDYCSVPLREKAYDRNSSSANSEIMFSARDQLCNQEYNSVNEARSAARRRGFSLGYSGLSIGTQAAKKTQTGRINISSTEFCKATKTGLKQTLSSEYEAQNASVAVNAWLECVKSSREDVLYLDYKIANDGQSFTGKLHTTANQGSLYRKITGMVVVGRARNSILCNIGGKQYRFADGQILEPIEVTSTGTAVACEKDQRDDGSKRDSQSDVSLAFQTSEGTTGYVDLPSESSLELAEWQTIKAEVQRLKASIVPLSALNASITGAVVAFNSSTCPDGNNWEEYTKAYGRFIRGIDKGNPETDPSGRRRPGGFQEDIFEEHAHNQRMEAQPYLPAQGSRYVPFADRGDATGPETGSRGGSETRPKNVALLYCIRK